MTIRTAFDTFLFFYFVKNRNYSVWRLIPNLKWEWVGIWFEMKWKTKYRIEGWPYAQPSVRFYFFYFVKNRNYSVWRLNPNLKSDWVGIWFEMKWKTKYRTEGWRLTYSESESDWVGVWFEMKWKTKYRIEGWRLTYSESESDWVGVWFEMKWKTKYRIEGWRKLITFS